jgi:hypothetical protein
VADDTPIPTAPLDYAAPEPPKRRRRLVVWLAVLTSAGHLLLAHLLWLALDAIDDPGLFYRFQVHLLYPIYLAADAGWLDPVPEAVLILVLLPLNSLLYGCVLTALAVLVARSSRLLQIAASALMAYPLLFAVFLYGEWLTAWWVLGHPPRSSLDDPKHVPISRYLGLPTYLTMLAIPWAACGAVVLNLALVLFHRPATPRVVVRFALLLALWSALAGVFLFDPGGVLYWWFD